MHEILFVPEVDPRRGIGHFKRLAFYLRAVSFQADILIPSAAMQERFARYCGVEVRRRFVASVPAGRRYRLVVLDTFTVRARAVRRYRGYAAVICALDGRGRGAAYCDYIIDVLPRVRGRAGNVAAPWLLPVGGAGAPDAVPPDARGGVAPDARAAAAGAPDARGGGTVSALIYFSGPSRARATVRAVRWLARNYRSALLNIAIATPEVSPSRLRHACAHHRYRQLPATPTLNTEIATSDIVVTSFGLTALTATLYGKKLHTIDPTRYHARCTQLLRADNGYTPQFFSSSFFSTLQMAIAATHPTQCPSCRGTRYRIYARFRLRSFARCTHCRLNFMLLHSAQPQAYDHRYFNDEYRQQYGKSYIEDFAHIYRISNERVAAITAARARRRGARRADVAGGAPPPPTPTLLDIGCAYGPFLAAAHDSGFDCYGIDVNPEALAYVRAHISARVAECAIEEFDPQRLFGRSSFDVISMWYVIEHIPNLEPILRRLYSLLPLGGILAFSTPNRESLPFRADLNAALHSSPVDHYTLWGAREARAILRRFGWQVVRVVMHGFDAQQYPGVPVWAGRFISSGLRYGTTFSLYARKVSR